MSLVTNYSMIRSAEVWAKHEGSEELTLNSQTGESIGATRQLLEDVQANFTPKIVHLDAANSAEHAAVLGIPSVLENELRAVLVLEIACLADSLGAVEIWCRDGRDELGLNGAVFSNLNRFARLSQFVRFPRGSGLPGKAWEDGSAKLTTGLGRSPDFMRAAGDQASGLDIGAALPVMTGRHDLTAVILLLSSPRSPLARAFEIWDIHGDEHVMRLSACASPEPTATSVEGRAMTYSRSEGFVGKIWESGIPLVSQAFGSIDAKRAASARADDLSTAIGLPIYVGSRLQSVFVMLN